MVARGRFGLKLRRPSVGRDVPDAFISDPFHEPPVGGVDGDLSDLPQRYVG